MKSDNNIICFRDRFLLVLMGIVVFSTLSANISVFFHFPITLPEPFFLVFLLLLKKRLLPITIDKGIFVFLVIVLLFSIIVSQIVGKYSLYSVLSSARGYLYLFLFYAIYKKNNKLTLEELFYISFGSLMGWGLACVITFQSILNNPTENFQTYGNMITVALFIAIAILKKKWNLFVVGMVLLAIISFMSGIRRVLAVIVMAMALAILFQYLLNKKSIARLILTTGLIVVPLIFVVPVVGKYAEENAPALYFRLFTRSERFVKGESDVSDDYRRDSFREFNNDLSSYMLPRGMVSNQYLKDADTGIYMDFPFLALSYIFSFPVAVLLVMFFIIRTLQCYSYYRFTSDISAGVFAIVTMVMFLLLFVEGSFLVHPYTTPFTGLCLGKVCYYGRLSKSMRH